ncbi:hypothetical protein CC1G_07246 [Coprinopsis cinerea okayama7|uniref:Uncharacterized protein n=1 Tax=Coprinopsis cinerea (strain Okayama-7 / 130 / ATCC MYA-4618 / FGSC 9003) TaxID=240176 RepID=A8PD30_COPC7|nr:hypothetical protein CC1G_07246 [Coprinopsis cinerea okayama7\|eukprot:XP_001840516.1 hypothetical protein CC1G_07246 [Coprinopsis cinerea okayama7\
MTDVYVQEKAEFVKDMQDVFERLYNLATTTNLHIADITPRLEWLNEYTDQLPSDAQDDHSENISDSLAALAAIQKYVRRMLKEIRDGRLRTREYIAEDVE